ncbi:hypothetical protein JJB07_10135 [Tumebacillus sp. ITR2]|uniref:Uncharacterized protein n=1 Tax=Tumebacillus amylolyticus TaxID=2801339 RepID=A0ABS1J9R0_9BACL|nr:hypothetical protein [Tumebacillus amylolyticus]MBL0387008.1 hypothetical protein [Tumebacillus amylolyticus]
MQTYITTITKWIVAFLIIFLLLMLLAFTFLYKKKSDTPSPTTPRIAYR